MNLSSDNDVTSYTDKDACCGNIADLENSELNSEALEEKSESVVDSHNSDNGTNVTSVADVIVERYNNIKRHTPRVGTLFCPDNKPDGKTGLQLLGSARRTILSAYSLKSIGAVSSDIGLRIENIGLKKYNRYMKSHRPNAFKNLECRSIIGQEDNSDCHRSSLKIKTMSSKEKKLASRPPVVGQASSSSNDSGSSFVMDRESSSPVSDAISCDEAPLSRCPADADLAINSVYFDDFASGHQQLRVVSNRDDYINEQPPEGSSEQESLTSQPDFQTELPRIPSPSSASSVASTSVRPLEWDSGADVGYYQMYPPENTDPDSKLSTIERIALARGSAVLLTRSDPEGTTGQNTQLVNQSTFNKALKRKMFLKDRLGAPVAESTPFSLNATSSMQLASGFVSGIEDVSPVIQIQSNVVSDDNTSSSNTETRKSPKKSGDICYQLFPELQKPQDKVIEHCEGAVAVTDVRNNSRCPVDGTGDHSPSNQSSPRESQSTDLSKQGSFGGNFSAHGQNVEDSTPRSEDDDLSVGYQRKVKKLSSSMELLNTKSNLNEKELPYTLPRSQSHSNIAGETNSNNINSLPKSLILRSFNPTKSASSSSISTVVHKKKDSPKRISKLIQTSYIQQSVGTQASGSDLYNAASASVSYKISDSLRSSSNLSEGNRANERSSYFSRPASINSSNNGTYERSMVQVQSKHTHDGLPCSGAHKKFSTSGCQMSYQKSDFLDQESQRGANRSDNVQGREINYMEGNESQNVKNCDTLESMESSAKSGQNMWSDRRESMGVEDRVNSFEYLPGHVFENSARKGNDSQGTSSVSLNQNGSSRNDYSDGTDRIWDVSASASSTLLRDINRGVHLMNDFVKNSHVRDDHLKQKLIKKVVEKLLKTDYPEDRQWMKELEKGPLPWMSPHHQDVAGICNGRETRRSHTKEIALHVASSSEKSSSRTSSECFRPQSIFIKNSSHPRETAEKCIGTDPSLGVNKELSEGKRPSVQSTSSDAITESNDSSLKPHSTPDEVAQQKNAGRITSARTSKVKSQQHIGNNKRPVNTSSNSNTTTDRSASVDCSSDWRDPVTKAEKLFEEKRKKQEAVLRRSHSGNQGEPAVLLQYLSIERENQLFWIKSEIEHLSNLKRLLEKQEQLKKSLSRLKIPKTRSALKASKLKHGPEITSSPKKSNSYNKSKCERKPHVLTDRNENRSQEYLGSDWSSHHYFSSTQNEKNDRSSKQNEIKPKEKSEVSENELRKRLKKLSVANTHSSSFGTKEQMSESHNKTVKNKNHVSTSSCSLSDDDDDDEVSVRAKKTVGTETTDTIGVQTSKSVQQLPLIKPAWFKNQKKSSKKETSCSCKCKGTCRYCKMNKQKKENKKSVAYFITFDDPSYKYDELEEETNLLENRAEDHFRNKKKIQHGKADVADSDDSSKSSDQKENHKPRRQVTRLRPTLQEYLLRNRADYVCRAEYRRQCVAELAYLRELRDKSKRHLITMAPDSSDYSQSSTPRDLPPPPLAVKRVFTQRTMRRQTERKYRQLAEVQSRQIDMKRKEAYRTNRLMAEVFTKKLQKRTLKGEVNLSNSVSVISTL